MNCGNRQWRWKLASILHLFSILFLKLLASKSHAKPFYRMYGLSGFLICFYHFFYLRRVVPEMPAGLIWSTLLSNADINKKQEDGKRLPFKIYWWCSLLISTAQEVFVFGVSLTLIFLHLAWIRRFTVKFNKWDKKG